MPESALSARAINRTHEIFFFFTKLIFLPQNVYFFLKKTNTGIVVFLLIPPPPPPQINSGAERNHITGNSFFPSSVAGREALSSAGYLLGHRDCGRLYPAPELFNISKQSQKIKYTPPGMSINNTPDTASKAAAGRVGLGMPFAALKKAKPGKKGGFRLIENT